MASTYSGPRVHRTMIAAEAIPEDAAFAINAAGKAVVATGTALPPAGISLEGASGDGKAFNAFLFYPTFNALAGGAITAGKVLAPTAGGAWIVATADNVWCGALALESAASGSRFEAMAFPHVTNDVSALGGN